MKKQAAKKATQKLSSSASSRSTKASNVKKKTIKNTGNDMRTTSDGKYDSGFHAGDQVW